MRPDIVDLQSFYGSPRGQLVRRLVCHQIRRLWPELAGERLLGLGYASPYLSALAENAERVVAVMPAQQGVARWPHCRRSLTALADDDALPLADNSVDRALLVHALEGANDAKAMLREVWRVLADGGRLLLVVPNRHGLWSLSDGTPFGHGRPYSALQLESVLRNCLFAPQQSAAAVFLPPVRSRLLLRTAFAWERVGLRVGKAFGGVLLIEAEKQVHAIPMQPAFVRKRSPAYLPLGLRGAAARTITRDELERAA